ncbi:unnamed protein product [Meganyctiphanes norvegica]|uniref:Pyroglutamyl-peptidase I n=1 Tax=Meganyctiphanes norvegica TaxID=48144 RepID=A0AAV2R5Q8_MEGNR
MGDPSPPTYSQATIGDVVYVTGFGPFGPHVVNASQKAVELLPSLGLQEELNARIVTEILSVKYLEVKEKISKRWTELKPKLVVHVGVAGTADMLTLEQLAHNCGYERQDIDQCLPQGGHCCKDGPDEIKSGIDMNKISDILNKSKDLKLPCAVSTDPGRFLCDYAYYTSLHEDSRRVVFIHVPTMNKYPIETISASVAAAIKLMYQQVKEYDSQRNE